MSVRKVLILGAAGRDFHNFNVVYRDDPATQVVAFTAAQIPGIAHRLYPPALAGPRYPHGIPIEEESQLEALCAQHGVDSVVFAYSDVTHESVMHLASRALAAGADFELLGPARTMVQAAVPVIAISGMRTGVGKSQVARWLAGLLRAWGLRVAAVRHPMPYGDLERQRVQRFASVDDLDRAQCTVEEREEYEPHIAAGNVVYAGVDYAEVIASAGREADIIVWDGGNNDFPFVRPDLHIGVADALRPGQADQYHPGEAVMRMADVILINKVDAAAAADVQRVTDEVRALNPHATIVRAASPVHLDDPDAVRGRRVLVIEDGPTITHGNLPYGAGYVAAVRAGAGEVIDPRPFAAPLIRRAYEQYPHIGAVLPALGYGDEQLAALEATIASVPADVVVIGSPVDLAARIRIRQPVTRAHYDLAETGEPRLSEIVAGFLHARGMDAPRDSARP
jgi:predicted GTPase